MKRRFSVSVGFSSRLACRVPGHEHHYRSVFADSPTDARDKDRKVATRTLVPGEAAKTR